MYTLQAMLCSIKIGVFSTILGYETLFRTSLWHMTFSCVMVCYHICTPQKTSPVLKWIQCTILLIHSEENVTVFWPIFYQSSVYLLKIADEVLFVCTLDVKIQNGSNTREKYLIRLIYTIPGSTPLINGVGFHLAGYIQCLAIDSIPGLFKCKRCGK